MLCEKSNFINKNIKKCDREIEKINFLSKNINNEIIEAYVIEIKPLSKRIQLYLPTYNMSFYINIFSEKIENLMDCNYNKNSIEIMFKNTEISNTFKLLEKMNILVSSRIEANEINKKCIISLLNSENEKIIDLLI
jgi:hypothetical protein